VVLEAAGGTSSEAILSAVAAVAPLGHVVCLGVYVPRVCCRSAGPPRTREGMHPPREQGVSLRPRS
jgi:threonine dehydrogenase-like Zn-dependent dehydrogenase